MEPALSRLHKKGQVSVLEVCNIPAGEIAESNGRAYPFAAQHNWEVSKKYEVFATPFAFYIGPDGKILATGVVNNDQHIQFLLSSVDERHQSAHHIDAAP